MNEKLQDNEDLQTVAVRIEKDIMQKIKKINKDRGMTITGLIRVLLLREIENSDKDT